MVAHNFAKVSLLQALSITHDYDIIFLVETFFDLPISNDDEKSYIKGCNIIWADNPSNKKKEAFVCIIRNTFLLLKEMIYVPQTKV